jgi:MOSC domain-containing protein YiiM
MKVISVNVGLPREVIWKGVNVSTGIFKVPVDGPVNIGQLNLKGDRQADLSVHGGPEKAVYAYPVEHYEYWRRQLPDVTFSWGQFGENLTTKGLMEDTLHIGDSVRVGSATLIVTQPRMPCYKLALRFGRDDMIKRFLASGRSGFYFSVMEAGSVSVGSTIQLVARDANRVSIADVQRFYLGPARDPELLKRIEKLVALPEGWKRELSLRAETNLS